MKVVVNRCFGGYGLSELAYSELGLPWDGYGYAMAEDRANPKLVEVVEKLRDAASRAMAKLEVVEIPDDIEWEIDYYDGMSGIQKE